MIDNLQLVKPLIIGDISNFNRVIVMFHGYGANAMDLMPLASFWHSMLPQTLCIIPTGIMSYNNSSSNLSDQFILNSHKLIGDEISNNSFAWFNLDNNLHWHQDEVDRHMLILRDWLLQLQKNLQDKLILMGFSQGGMIALELALKHLEVDGVMVFAGALLNLHTNPLINSKHTKIFWCHNTSDDVVSIEFFNQGVEFLKGKHYHLTAHAHEEDRGHSMGKQSMESSYLWLKNNPKGPN